MLAVGGGDRRGDGDASTFVRAAGGVVLRSSSSGEPELLVIHRHRRHDWSLPKGKLEPGEDWEVGALREVAEETGFECRLGRFVGYTQYVDRRGSPKVVAYWLMEVVHGRFTPNDEVDEIEWLPKDEAIELLSYPRDRDLVASLRELALAHSA